VRYKQPGRTGVKVSAVSLGTATFGVAPLEKDCDRLIGRAMDLGINMIDVANGTDCIVVASPCGDEAQGCAGLHTAVGEAIGGAVYDATRDGAQQWDEDIQQLGL
jgi:hypothetical protein